MKFKHGTAITFILLFWTLPEVKAAQELSAEKAQTLTSFKQITLNGRFNNLGEVAEAVSRQADKLSAYAFYVQGIHSTNRGGNWRVTANLYHKDAAVLIKKNDYRIFNGVKELPQKEAELLLPFDTVNVTGFFRSQSDVDEAISKKAAEKKADAFFIIRQINANRGGNQSITAYIYEANAPKRPASNANFIPADSDDGKAALAAGGGGTKKILPIHEESSMNPFKKVGRLFERDSSVGSRYSVTLPNGIKIEELNNIAAKNMKPFDRVTFTGHFSSMTDVSYQVAKRAAKKGAKYYHITRQWQSKNGGNLTVTADLFK
ncbi:MULTISPECIES: DUF1471 family protein YdgH [Candidatus Williamhamiltonella]|uniref:YdgH/BhsA/McbA-like domain-containing protein n=1 Tax=Candidatus Williamhamiltonella defendens TaxID=138072 RepID=A0A2D3TCK6_9ENTR|nr:DUF1471 family protein YdgH [Candidatus Hamiltonella defensa]ATW33463.1 hypothetical protein BJP43_03265 [Candidatus Hamiltonella defensa]